MLAYGGNNKKQNDSSGMKVRKLCIRKKYRTYFSKINIRSFGKFSLEPYFVNLWEKFWQLCLKIWKIHHLFSSKLNHADKFWITPFIKLVL